MHQQEPLGCVLREVELCGRMWGTRQAAGLAQEEQWEGNKAASGLQGGGSIM